MKHRDPAESEATERVILNCAISIKHVFRYVDDKKKLDCFAENLPTLCKIATGCQSRDEVENILYNFLGVNQKFTAVLLNS